MMHNNNNNNGKVKAIFLLVKYSGADTDIYIPDYSDAKKLCNLLRAIYNFKTARSIDPPRTTLYWQCEQIFVT